MQFVKSLAIILSLVTAIANPVPSQQQGAAESTAQELTKRGAKYVPTNQRNLTDEASYQKLLNKQNNNQKKYIKVNKITKAY